MAIEAKYLKLLGNCVYNKELDKFGYISSTEINPAAINYLYYTNFKIYYDIFLNDIIAPIADFKDGKLQFAVIKEGFNSQYLEDIKKAFGGMFSKDMIKYISDEEKRRRDSEDAQKMGDLSIILANDSYFHKIYSKYKENILTKEQALYALVNHLAQELKREKDRNTKYFFKYEFLPEIEGDKKDET